MKLEKQSSGRGIPRRKGRSSFAFLICFRPSSVYDSDGPPHAAARDRSPRLFCFSVRKKKKKKSRKKKAVKVDTPAADESRLKSNASIAKDRDVDNNNGSDIGDNKQLADRRRASNNDQAQSSQNHHFNRARSEINDSKLRRNIASRIGKLDPSIGTGIMAITLAVMVFVGRSAAILCLCSFLYIFRLVRISSSKDKEVIIDMDPAENKKRVISKGLLQRNGPNPSNIVHC